MFRRATGLMRQHAVALVALFVALGGTSYALGAGTVGSVQLRNNAVTSRKLTFGAKNYLRSRDFVVRTNSNGGVGTSAKVSCNAGERAVGGGGDTTPPSRSMRSSRPTTGGSPSLNGREANGWAVVFSGTGSIAVTAYAICTPSP